MENPRDARHSLGFARFGARSETRGDRIDRLRGRSDDHFAPRYAAPVFAALVLFGSIDTANPWTSVESSSSASFPPGIAVQVPSPPVKRPGHDPRPPRNGSGQQGGTAEELPAFEDLLASLAEKAAVYKSIALRFVCVETNRDSERPNDEKIYDYMYVEEEAQRYRPYRQRHAEDPNQTRAEIAVEHNFPDSYSWTLIFLPERQHLFKFEDLGEDWFSLRRARVVGFTAPLPYSSGRTIYEWTGRVWVDAENYNFLKIEAEPANQEERLRQMLREYRQAPRLLVFPMKSRPAGGRYAITFLSEFQRLSLPDQADYQEFLLDLEGNAELTGFTTQRYSRYQFFGVELRDRFLR